MLDLSAGQIVADKYRIDGVIGVGGMGVVLAATHLDLDQRVAIKVLREASPEAVARFRREARLIVRLKSAHVARVFDIGVLDDDTPYIVMELLDGEDLAKHVGKGGRVGVQQAVDWVLEACEALAEAHALGMVHRDLKPANLFLARGPGGAESVKVLDFGISKSMDEHDGTGLTNEGVALGSPGYMSPEQMDNSRDVDVRSDVYSIGAILYRLTSGQNPYKGDSFMSVLAAMADGLPPSLRSVAPDAPPGFAAVVERCLARDRDARPANLAELAHALVPFGSTKTRGSAERIAATLGFMPPSGPTFPVTMASSPASPPPAVADAMATLDVLGATVVSPITPRATPSDMPSPAPSDPAWPSYSVAPHAQAATAPSRLETQRHVLLGALAIVALLAGALAWASFRSSTSKTATGAPVPIEARAHELPAATTPTATTLTSAPPATEHATAPVVTNTAPAEPTTRTIEPPSPKTKPTRPPPHRTGSQGARRPADTSAPPSPTDVPPSRH